MNSSSTEGNRPHRKDAVRSRKPHFTDKSQAPHFHGSDYKQRIKVLSKDNKELTTALQNTRSDLADKEKVLDNVKSAEAIMIKLHSSMKSFLEDFEQVLCLLNTNNTNWPVSGSLLQPRNEFRKEKKVMPEISTGKICMIVKEIVAKEVESFDISKNDEGSTVKNHHVSADQVTKVSNGTAEESTSKSLPNGVVDKSTKKRKCSSNNSEQPASKRNKSILDERSREESSNHILRHSLKMPSRKRSFLSKTEKKTNGEESTAAESKNEENMYTSTSVKFAKTQKKKSQLRSTADKIKDDKYEQVESGSENEMKNTLSRNSSSSRRTGSVDDASLCKTFVPELDTEHIKVETSCQNTIRLSKMSKRKTLPNKRKGIKSQSEQGAEKSQSEELKSASFSIKSLKMTRRGSQAESTSNKSENDNLKIQNPDFVKKKKKHGQIVSEKAVNRNTETLKERTVVSANDAFQNETLISVRKLSLNKLFVKCSDVLIDPSFESDPFVSKFKKNSLMNYKDNKEKISSIKIDNEDEHLDTEDINVSSKQAPLFHNESDVIETKKTVSTNNSASWRRKGKHRANRLDDSSEDESSSIKTDNEDEHLDTEDINVSSKQAPLFHNASDVIETKKNVSTNNSASWRRKGKHRANRLDDSSEDESSSIKTDNEDEHLDTEDISVSSKQAPLFHNESDVIETKKTVSTNNSASWRRKGKHRANRLDDSSEDESSSIKTDNEDEHLDTEDISVSSKQAPLFHNESDVIETKKTVSTNNSASWRRKGKHRANRLDDSSEDEFPLNQLNASKKKDVSSTTGNLSDLDTERFDLTAVGQDAKPKEKFNVDKADLSEDRAGKAKFNTDKFKATDADSEDDEHENESGMVKENREKQADEQSEKIVCQEKLRVEEVKSTPFSAKSLRMQRRDSQKESTADESRNELKIENLATVKKKKRHQIESEKTPNNTKNSKKERSTKKPVSVDYVVQNGSVTSESKTSLNKVIVKCCDILVDPSFESDPFVKKFKKDNLLNYNSSRNYEGSGKGKTYEIHAEIHAEPVSSKNLDCKDKNSVMKDINESSKQVPSTSYESDSVKTKNAVSRYGSTSRRGKCIASNMDDSLPDETSLTQPNSSGKDDVFSTIVELSDLDSEMSDSTSVDQMNKPKKEFNENKTDLNENKIYEIESDADETKGIDANSKDKEENENDSESCVVKKNEQRSTSNHCTSFFYKSALERKEPASLKQTLQNKREELDNREKLSAEESESEDLRPTLFSVESIKKPRRGSQAESSTDESKNDKLRIVNPASVKEIKAHSQIKCKKIANSNTEISKNGKVLSAYDAFQDETLISESKSSLNNLFVKCVDVLIDPSFESDPVISRFKKDNFLNYDSSKDDEGSIKGEFYEIVDEDDEEIEFSENPDSEDEHLGTEDIECSKQEPSITYESDSIETKTAVPRNYSTSRNSRDIALSVDKLSQDESSLNQLNASEKEDFNSTNDKLSDLNSEKFYSTDVCQGDKSEKEYNENNAELKRNEVSETESNVDDTKAADSNSKDEENKNELKSSIVKENKNKEDSNEVSEIVSKADEAKFIDAVSKEENENRSESSMDKGNRDEANIKEVKVAETESNADADKATDTNSKDKEENENK